MKTLWEDKKCFCGLPEAGFCRDASSYTPNKIIITNIGYTYRHIKLVKLHQMYQLLKGYKYS